MEPVRSAAGCYVLVDVENLDWAIANIVGRKPEASERVQFDRLVDFCTKRYAQPVKVLVVLNIKGDQLPDAILGFVKALRATGCDVVPVYGRPDQKVVDLAILKLLGAIQTTSASLILASHDGGDFAEALKPLLLGGTRSVAVLGFRELLSSRFKELQAAGLKLIDLETDAGVFLKKLPRLIPIRIDDFDAAAFL